VAIFNTCDKCRSGSRKVNDFAQEGIAPRGEAESVSHGSRVQQLSFACGGRGSKKHCQNDGRKTWSKRDRLNPYLQSRFLCYVQGGLSRPSKQGGSNSRQQDQMKNPTGARWSLATQHTCSQGARGD
jgi:hypothetical protein